MLDTPLGGGGGGVRQDTPCSGHCAVCAACRHAASPAALPQEAPTADGRVYEHRLGVSCPTMHTALRVDAHLRCTAARRPGGPGRPAPAAPPPATAPPQPHHHPATETAPETGGKSGLWDGPMRNGTVLRRRQPPLHHRCVAVLRRDGLHQLEQGAFGTTRREDAAQVPPRCSCHPLLTANASSPSVVVFYHSAAWRGRSSLASSASGSLAPL